MLLPLTLCLAPLAPQSEAESPRLVVMLAVDQLIPEQLERLEGHLDGGLGRLLREGTRFVDAALPYASTATGPGHATYATGCLPKAHGLVGNSFFDRRELRDVYCVEDREARIVTSTGQLELDGNGRSPRNLQRPSMGAHLRASHPGAKVVCISAKDRAAISMAGADADLALWWDRGAGRGFVSSDHYGAELPDWVSGWNADWIERTAGWIWEPGFDLENPPPGTAPDDRVGEGRIGSAGPTFPYVFGSTPSQDYDVEQRKQLGRLCYQSPLVDRFVFEQGRLALVEQDLGRDEVVDLLGLSFSACDTVGHTFGPYSAELTDLLLRLDDQLGEFFTLLDQHVGKGRWIASLTADHGVLPLAETLVEQGLTARRIGSEPRRALQRHAERAVAASFRLEDDRSLRFKPGYQGFSFDKELSKSIGEAGLDPALVRQVIAAAAKQEDWVQDAYTHEQLVGSEPTDDNYLALARASHTPDRGLDVLLVLEPFHLVFGETGTSHGSPHAYDRRVPLLFLAPGLEPGDRDGEAGSHDAVPTLLELLGIEPAAPLDGRSLLSR